MDCGFFMRGRGVVSHSHAHFRTIFSDALLGSDPYPGSSSVDVANLVLSRDERAPVFKVNLRNAVVRQPNDHLTRVVDIATLSPADLNERQSLLERSCDAVHRRDLQRTHLRNVAL